MDTKDAGQKHWTPPCPPDVMEETKYPVTPTKPHSNTNSQSYMESPFNTPHGNRDFAQLVEDSDGNTGRPENTRSTPRKRENRTKRLCRLVDKLHNENEDLKVRIDELTTASRNLAMEKSCCDKMHEHDILQRIISYAKDHSLHYGNLTMESVHTMLSNIHHKLRASNHPRTASENLEAQIQALRMELAASHAQCQSLGKRQAVSNAKLRESLQNLAISQDEAQSLRTQMQALQKEMLAQLSKVEVISDETFARDFHILASLVKSLSLSVQSAQDVDVVEVLDPILPLNHVAKHHWDTRARKKDYIEAWIWSFLIMMVFEHPFSFWGSSRALYDNWKLTFGESVENDWPEPTPKSENWRRTTTEELVGRIGRETVTSGQIHGGRHRHDKHAQKMQTSVLKTRERVANTISAHLTIIEPNCELSHISDIVDRAFALALDISIQPSRIQFTWPEVGDDFEVDHMSPIPDRNGQDIDGGVVAFIVNPGLTRWGDARGQNFEKCHEIVPSLVQLEPVQAQRRSLRSCVKIKQERGYA